jgi:signal transduction histidine kinase
VNRLQQLLSGASDESQREFYAQLSRRSLPAAPGQVVLLTVFVLATRLRSDFPAFVTISSCLILAFNLLRFILALDQPDLSRWGRRNWRVLFFLGIAVPGAAWGALFFLALQAYGPTGYSSVIAMLIGSGITAAITTSVSPWPDLPRAFTLLVIGIPLIELLIRMDRQTIPMAVIFVTYIAFLWFQIDIQSRDFWGSVLNRERLLRETRLASLGELASSVVHEIRNPLTVITLAAELIRRESVQGTLTPEESHANAERIVETAKRMDRIIAGIMRFSRDAEGEPFTVARLSQIVADSIALVSPRFLTNDVAIRMNPVPDWIEIECRPVEISQVFVNLLNNALDACRNGRERWVRIGVLAGEQSVSIRVTDSGPGMPASVRDHIFEPFFTTKGPAEGTGLGLSISQRIIRGHGGQLGLDPRAQNTTFVIRLPLARAAAFAG